MASTETPRELFLVRVERGGPWDWSRDMRDQEQWREHADFMNALVDDGFILLGGPVEGGREAFHVVDAASEEELRARLAADPWARERNAHREEHRALDHPPRSRGVGTPR